MRLLFGALMLAALSVHAKSQELIQTTDGIFLCDGRHPRCFVLDQSTYPYYQFGGQHVGQMSGVSDVLENGPPLIHYQTFLAELITERPNTNAVAFWADAESVVDGGRVWGGFISARSELPAGHDSQLIGLEIDVLNDGLPGTYPNASKVGLQIVGFGNPNTNAIEILTETPSAAFQNIINIQPNSVALNGTVIGMTPQTAARGIDFLGSTFSDAAFLVSANQKFVFRSPGSPDAAIWRDEINNGYLVLQAGPPGLRIVNADNSRNLLVVTPDGDLVTPYGSFTSVLGRLNVLEQLGGGAGGGWFAANNASAAGVPTSNGSNSSAGAPGAVASGDRSLAVGNSSEAVASQATAIGYAAQSSGVNSVALGANSNDGGQANVVSVGSSTQTRRITNVGPATSITDAVNLGQLNNSMNQAIASAQSYTDAKVNQLGFDLAQVRRDADGATAAAMALAGIPQSFERGMGMVGIGMGTWQGESAVAIGASKATDDGRFVFKAGATYNSRNQGGANAGMGLAF